MKQSRKPSSEKMENTIIKNEARIDIIARQLKDIGKNMITKDKELRKLINKNQSECTKRQDNVDEVISNVSKELEDINKDLGEAIHIIAYELKDIRKIVNKNEISCLKREDNLHNMIENIREKDAKYINRKLDSIDTSIEKLKMVLKSHIDYTKTR